jgi:hypothetical protein
MSPEHWLVWVNRVYFGAGGVAVLATAVTVIAGVVQSRLNDSISARKDREFSEFKVTSETRVAELQKLTAEANLKAEEDRLARMKIEERLAPRSITPDQLVSMSAAVSKFAPVPIAIWEAGETEEIGTVSRSVLAALQLAHWSPNLWTWTGIGPILGLIIVVKPNSAAPVIEAADALVAALNGVGLQCNREPWAGDWDQFGGMLNGLQTPGPTSAPIRLIIGAKAQR